MKNFVQYHKIEKMGYSALDVNHLSVYTNKNLAKRGDRVWIIAGEGTPRKYYLRAAFEVKKLVYQIILIIAISFQETMGNY